MKRREDSVEWYLYQMDADRPNSFECGYQKSESADRNEIWDNQVNNLISYQEIKYKDNRKELKSLYTKKHPGMRVKISYGSDPLLIVL